MAEELLDGANEKTVIAVISTPSVFVKIRNILVRVYPTLPMFLFRICN